MVYPIVEMAGTRVTYVPEVLHLYIEETDYSEGKETTKQDRVLNIIKQKEKQDYVECLFGSGGEVSQSNQGGNLQSH